MNNAEHQHDPLAPHQLAWTPEHVTRFWDWWGSRPQSERDYFAAQVGPRIVRLARPYLPRQGLVVDYGAGGGHLTRELLDEGYAVLALDASPRSVVALSSALRSRPNFVAARRVWQGTPDDPLRLDRGRADAAFCLETVEHLDDDALDAVLGDLRALLKLGGTLIITTPNEEDLAASETLCAACGSVFHRMQHVRSWSGRTLAATLERHGFRTLAITRTRLSGRPWYLEPLVRLRRVLDRLTRRKATNLIWIGQRVR